MAESYVRPVDRVGGAYLVVSAAALAFPHRPDGWPLLLLLHLGVAAGLFGGALAPIRRPGRRVGAVVADWYPLILLPLIYLETQLLNRAVWDGHYFDDAVMSWEEAIFGGQPSVTLAARWDSLLLSELLHLAYLSYFFMVYLFPAALYLTGRREAFEKTVFAILLGFAAHYLVFIFFPVQGPRYLFPGPTGRPTDGVFYRLTRTVLERSSSQGAAFPSSHVALGAIVTGSAARFAPKVAPVFVVLTLGIAAGAVYGGFHYAVDVTAGLVTGVLLALSVPVAWRLLR